MTLPFSPAELDALRENEPDKYFAFVARLAASTNADIAKQELHNALVMRAKAGCTLDGFDAWYELVHGGKMLGANYKQAIKCFQAHEDGEIFLYIGFRGVRKTTTFDITLTTFLHGYFPEKTGIVTGAADPNVKLIAKSIAQIIEQHPAWKEVFPNVVPYKERGWGAEGYWIRDANISPEKWTEQQAKVNDPSFVGGGYRSAEINGKHPSLYLVVDDLHDIDSSASVTEREYIKMVFLTQILKTVLRANDKLLTWVIMTGVPFSKDDTYAVLKNSGGTTYCNVPVMTRAPDGQGVYIDGKNRKTGVVYDDIVGWWYLTEPEIFGANSIVDERSKGKASFWQMYMLDIQMAKTGSLTYYTYDHDKIGFDLPTVGGADPSGIDPDMEVGGQKRSSFALCYLCKLPMGGAVVKDGVLKPMGIVKAKDAILQAQSMFPKWETTGVEDVGVGKVFMQYLRTDSRVNFIASNIKSLKDAKIRDKKLRFLNEIHPWIESGVIRISDENTPFLNALRYLMDNFFDIDANKPNEALDAGDSLYHAVKLIPEILRMPSAEDLSPQGMNDKPSLWHPFFGARHGK